MFHSEYGQDQFVDELLGGKRDGTFVEFGALDGVLHSNSLFFERERGWGGLLIEANPDAFKELEKNRPNVTTMNVAVYDHRGRVGFAKIDGGCYGWSGIAEEFEEQHFDRIIKCVALDERELIHVPCVCLADCLIPGIDIDYMSIDVEGAELKILQAFPFENYSIDVLGVEDNFGNQALDTLIRSKGYRFLQKVGPDRMYRRAG